MKQHETKKPTMRKLTEPEVKMTNAALKGVDKALARLEYLKELNTLKLNEGVDIAFVEEEAKLRKEHDEAEEGSYARKKNALILEKGIVFAIEKQKSDLRKNLGDIEREMNTLKYQAEVANEQLKNGVEAKNGDRKTPKSK